MLRIYHLIPTNYLQPLNTLIKTMIDKIYNDYDIVVDSRYLDRNNITLALAMSSCEPNILQIYTGITSQVYSIVEQSVSPKGSSATEGKKNNINMEK